MNLEERLEELEKAVMEANQDRLLIRENQCSIMEKIKDVMETQLAMMQDSSETLRVNINMLKSIRNLEEVVDLIIELGYRDDGKGINTLNLTEMLDDIESYMEGIREMADYGAYYQGIPWCEREPISSFRKKPDMAS